MMNKSVWLLVVLSVFCLVACEQNSEQRFNEFKDLSEDIQGEYLKGEFHEMISSDGDYVLLIKREGSKTFTDFIRVQVENVPAKLGIDSYAEAILLEKGIVLKSRESNAIHYIGLEGSEKELNNYVAVNESLSGYGMSRLYGSWEFDDFQQLNEFTTDELIILHSTELSSQEKNTLLDNSRLMSCSSGGEGSSSCSQGAAGSYPSCSVSCLEGYYACCNVNSCKCEESQPDNGEPSKEIGN